MINSKQTPKKISAFDLAQMIDISAVQSFHDEKNVRDLAEIAKKYHFISAHSLPHFTSLLSSLLPQDTGVIPGGPIGFPSGGHKTTTKVAEAKALIEDGAREIDLMMNIARLKSGDDEYVFHEVQTIVQTVAPIPLKVIIEVTRLTDEEIIRASTIIAKAKAAFVKTGTGWTGMPTRLEHIRLINQALDNHGKNNLEKRAEIKASGGIRDLQTISEMIALGVTRFGVNTEIAMKLVQECHDLGGLTIDH